MKALKIITLLFLTTFFFNISSAQETPLPEEAMASVDIAARYSRDIIINAAQQMPEEYYSFRPTPELRSFGELLAHIAESNSVMCAIAIGKSSPIEKVNPNKTEVLKALNASFEFSEQARKNMTAQRKETIVKFRDGSQTAGNVLDFSVFHSLQHYGNVIVYMRLKGLVPPSSQSGKPGSDPVKQVPKQK